jgi:hypothetical protein
MKEVEVEVRQQEVEVNFPPKLDERQLLLANLVIFCLVGKQIVVVVELYDCAYNLCTTEVGTRSGQTLYNHTYHISWVAYWKY